MKVLIVFHSITGNTALLAKAIADGCKEISGSDVRLRKVKELIPEEILAKNPQHAENKKIYQDIPEVQIEELKWCDGLLIGSPTRYGNMSAQVKEFIDSTGKIWMAGELVGKAGGVFTTSETLHGGKEATLISSLLPLLGQGMVIVGVPQTFKQMKTHGSYYGPVATGKPVAEDIEIAKEYGARFAEVTGKLAENSD